MSLANNNNSYKFWTMVPAEQLDSPADTIVMRERIMEAAAE